MEQTLEIKAVNIKEHYQDISGMMYHLHEHEHTLFDKTAHAWWRM
jgi:hypothetical protein